MSDNKRINLSKQSLLQLQELLQRQNALLKNTKILKHLHDNGESIKQLRDKIQKEIEFQQNLENIESSLSTLTLNFNISSDVKDKHVEYVCSKEKPIEDTRYRPHRTLIQKETKPSQIYERKGQVQEVTSALEPKLIHEPVKCIPLAESLQIQHEHTQKQMEGQMKRMFAGLDNLLEVNVGDENDDDDDKFNENQDEFI